jgi:Skp1 family, dimerisation domain
MQIRSFLNMHDLTAEEEEEARKEHSWLFS